MTEEEARVKRAYNKYSNNLQEWNKTITKFNINRQKGMKKQRSPIRSLVELQDSYCYEHLPYRLKEHIEDEIDAIEATRTVPCFGHDNLTINGSMRYMMENGPSAPSIGDLSMPYDSSTFTCGKSCLTHGEKRYKLRKKYGERFDNKDADAKFY